MHYDMSARGDAGCVYQLQFIWLNRPSLSFIIGNRLNRCDFLSLFAAFATWEAMTRFVIFASGK